MDLPVTTSGWVQQSPHADSSGLYFCVASRQGPGSAQGESHGMSLEPSAPGPIGLASIHGALYLCAGAAFGDMTYRGAQPGHELPQTFAFAAPLPTCGTSGHVAWPASASQQVCAPALRRWQCSIPCLSANVSSLHWSPTHCMSRCLPAQTAKWRAPVADDQRHERRRHQWLEEDMQYAVEALSLVAGKSSWIRVGWCAVEAFDLVAGKS